MTSLLQVFIGKIPREIFEDELIPLCEEVGKIWDLRLMIDPASGFSKGYCFVTYCNQSDSIKAAERVRSMFVVITENYSRLTSVERICYSSWKNYQS
jgi:RNA recognition motif-containing protein